MGCDIHSFAEVKRNNKWEVAKDFVKLDDFERKYQKKDYGSCPFDWRSYGMFAFLAGVRNYSHVDCITGEPRGLPEDSEYLNTPTEQQDWSYGGYSNGISETKGQELTCDANYHSHSHIYLKELLEWDYDKKFWDRRISRSTIMPGGGIFTDGACLAEEGEGEMVTYKDFLGESFFRGIKELQTLGNPEDVRIVFWFDS